MLVRIPAVFITASVVIVLGLSFWSGAARTGANGGPGVVSVGYDHTCALISTGNVQCWGSNAFGQLGAGTLEDSSVPVGVCAVIGCPAHLTNIRSVSAGREHTCALTNAGGVQCWGENVLMQLGNGSNENSSVPISVTGLSSGVAQLSSGRYYNCVTTASGGAECWGSNFYGQLGDGTNVDRGAPVDVVGLQAGVRSVETERYHTCAVMIAGAVKCWGDNADGELGHPGVSTTNTPVDVCADLDCQSLLSGITAISLGLHSTCALTTNGGVKCWGANDFGQLGNGSRFPSPAPVDVIGLTNGVTAVSAGEANVCVTLGAGISAVKCWGDNRFGQLGNGTTTDSIFPGEVCSDSTCTSPLSSAAAVSAGSHQACALRPDSHVLCWGLNSTGQLGDGTLVERSAPVASLVIDVKPAPTAQPVTPSPSQPPTVTPTQTLVPTSTATPTPATVIGDANCDHAVNSIDAAVVLQYGAGLLSTLQCPAGGDANHDGHINALDAALVLQYVAALLTHL